MGEIIDPTLIAFHFDEPPRPEDVELRLTRVRDHYQELAHEPFERSDWLGTRQQIGLVSFHDPVLRCAWPHWTVGSTTTLATAYIPIGWQRITGIDDPAMAAPRLADRLGGSPEEAAGSLNAPQALVLVDRSAEKLTIVNDCIGAGRLYGMRFPGGTLWSNRVGALSLFGGVAPEPDERGWSLFAAGGWFMGDTTPIRGATKLAPASIVEVSREGGVTRRTARVAETLVSGGPLNAEAVDLAAGAAKDAIRSAGLLFGERPRVDLSGGRDSRISAAAAICAGVDVEMRTSDIKPGEADVARELLELAPWKPDHKIQWGGGEKKRQTKPLRERALSSFLLHDGMRYAGRVRGRVQIPPPPEQRASISGHGGEIAHGFYYPSEKKLRQAERKGREGALGRLMRSCRRTHSAGGEGVYEIAEAEFERSFDEGEAAGVTGPALLDWFYLLDRFPHRSGLSSHTQRVTVFSSPPFISAAFALSPADRLANRLHEALIDALVPEWSGVPYYEAPGGRTPKLRRERIWEGADRRAMSEMLSGEDCWQDVFDAKRVRVLWRRARLRRGRSEWEQVFERIACRVAFEDWAARIRARL